MANAACGGRAAGTGAHKGGTSWHQAAAAAAGEGASGGHVRTGVTGAAVRVHSSWYPPPAAAAGGVADIHQSTATAAGAAATAAGVARGGASWEWGSVDALAGVGGGTQGLRQTEIPAAAGVASKPWTGAITASVEAANWGLGLMNASTAATMSDLSTQSPGGYHIPAATPTAAVVKGSGGGARTSSTAAEIRAIIDPLLLDGSIHEELALCSSQLTAVEVKLHWLDWCLTCHAMGILTWWQAAQFIIGLRPYPPFFSLWLRRLATRTSLQLPFSLWSDSGK